MSTQIEPEIQRLLGVEERAAGLRARLFAYPLADLGAAADEEPLALRGLSTLLEAYGVALDELQALISAERAKLQQAIDASGDRSAADSPA